MKKYLVAIIITLLAGWLLFGANLHSSKAFAASSDTSTDPSTSSSTTATDPTTTGSNDTSANNSTSQDASTAAPDTTTTTDTTTTPSTTPSTDSTSSSDPTTSDTTTTPTNSDSVCPSSSDTSTDPSTSTSTTPSSTDSNSTTVNNNVGACAQSGDATVTQNQSAGNATTGGAGDVANVVNSLGSSSSLGSGGLQTFTDNINGNVNGNVTINPADFISYLESGASNASYLSAINNTDINNYINLIAQSGNASVEQNGVAGNAVSGDAITEANIINLLDSMITDNQSFLGIVNIFGNLNGNILIPQSLIDSLMNQTTSSGSPPTNETNENNVGINNTVNLSAITGDALVAGNGSAGNATSGNALTKLNIYNFTNAQISGGNVLLVFVNVMGNWVGLLLNDPAGTTSAALGGQIQQDVSSLPLNTTSINNEQINNTINLSSVSGNALVTGNDIAGNATSGNASASADIVNIVGSNIDLSGWLGILIINVFGTWTGNLAIAPTTTSSSISDPTMIVVAIANPSTHHYKSVSGGDQYGSSISGPSNNLTSSVITPSTDGSLASGSGSITPGHQNAAAESSYNLFAIISLSIGAGLIGAERFFSKKWNK